ncbi:MAG: SxtJ family membrane protein [Rhizobacter sp.]
MKREHASKSSKAPSTESALRKFGLLMVICLIGLGLWPTITSELARGLLLGAGLFVGVATVFRASFLRRPFELWMFFGDCLHHLVSPIVLAALFFLLICPVGLLMRALGKTFAPQSRPDKTCKTYWVDREPSSPTKDSFRHLF